MDEIRVQENNAMFDEIMKHCQVNMDISSWEYSSDNYTGNSYNARPLACKKTGQHVGWLVYTKWTDATGEIDYETHISIKEDDLNELLKQDRW